MAPEMNANEMAALAEVLTEMDRAYRNLERSSSGAPIDDDGEGGFAAFEVADGYLLELDWTYLDARSTNLLVDDEVRDFDAPERYVPVADLSADLGTVVGEVRRAMRAANPEFDARFEWHPRLDMATA